MAALPIAISIPSPSTFASSSTSPKHPLRLPVAHAASSGSNGYKEEERRRLAVERYGLDPADFDSRSFRQERGRDKIDGRRKKPERVIVVPEVPKSPRTTHKLLKVLAGTAHRKKLLSPTGMDVRPMMEVVKGAGFDIIQAASGLSASLMPGRWLDLYSGTGSVGIEALSRGCAEAHFVEMDSWVVTEVLKPNLKATGFFDDSVIHLMRVEKFLEGVEDKVQGPEGSFFDYISVTPPYDAVDYHILMHLLEKSSLVGDSTFMLVEYPLKTILSDSCKGLVKIADRKFGRTKLAVYGPKWAQKERKSGVSKLLNLKVEPSTN